MHLEKKGNFGKIGRRNRFFGLCLAPRTELMVIFGWVGNSSGLFTMSSSSCLSKVYHDILLANNRDTHTFSDSFSKNWLRTKIALSLFMPPFGAYIVGSTI